MCSKSEFHFDVNETVAVVFSWYMSHSVFTDLFSASSWKGFLFKSHLEDQHFVFVCWLQMLLFLTLMNTALTGSAVTWSDRDTHSCTARAIDSAVEPVSLTLSKVTFGRSSSSLSLLICLGDRPLWSACAVRTWHRCRTQSCLFACFMFNPAEIRKLLCKITEHCDFGGSCAERGEKKFPNAGQESPDKNLKPEPLKNKLPAAFYWTDRESYSL